MALVGETQGPVGVCGQNLNRQSVGGGGEEVCIREGCLEEVLFGMKLPVGSVSGPSIPLVFSQCRGKVWRWEMD